MAKLTELQQERLPILEAREKNRAKNNKNKAKVEEACNKALGRLNGAIQAGMSTLEELEDSEKKAAAAEKKAAADAKAAEKLLK